MDLSGLESLNQTVPQHTPSSIVVGPGSSGQPSSIPGGSAIPIFGLNIRPSSTEFGSPSRPMQEIKGSPLNIGGLEPIQPHLGKNEPQQYNPERLNELISNAFNFPPMISFDDETMDKWEIPNLVCNTCQTSLPPIIHLLYRAMIRGKIRDPNHRIKLVSKLGLSNDDQDTLLYPERFGRDAKLNLLSVYGLPPSEVENLKSGTISSPFALKIVKKIFGIDQICCNGQIMFPLRMVLGQAIDPEFMQRLDDQIRIISGNFNTHPIGPTFDSIIVPSRPPSVLPGIYMDTNPNNDPFIFLRQISFHTLSQDPNLDPNVWIQKNL